MFTSVPVAAVFLILGIIVFILLCYRGVNTALAALAAAMVVGLGATDGWLEAIFTVFPSGIGNFVINNAMVYLSAGLFAFLMRETKSGNAIADNMVRLIGANRAPIIIIVLTAIIQIAGISTYVLVAPIAIALMRAADMPISIGYASCMGIPPLISFCLPGVTAMPNVLPTTFLHTTIYAAPLMGITCALIGLVLATLYLTHIIHRARRRGEHFVEPGAGMAGINVAKEGRFGEVEVPAMWKGIAPLAGVLVLSFIMINVFKLPSARGICVAMWICCAFMIVANWDVCIHKITLKNIISCGPMEIVPFMFMAGCVYGFGNVTSASACFEPLKQLIMTINLNPYLTAFLSIALVAALCADGVAGMMMWLGMFSETFLAMPGVNPAALHRILVMSATTFDSLPHSGSVAGSMAMFQTTHKESYGHVFVLTVCIPVIFSLVGVAMAILLY